MNLLIILPWLPYPYNTGGNQAVMNSIEAIHNEVNVYLVALGNPKAEKVRQEMLEMMPNITIDLFYPHHYKFKELEWPLIVEKIVNHLFYHKKKQSEIFNYLERTRKYGEFDTHWMPYLANIIEKYKIDIVQCEFLETIGLITVIPNNIKKIFVHHELGYIRDELELAINPKRDILIPMAKRRKAIEIGFLNQYDGVITLSGIDAKKLKCENVAIPIYPSFAIVKNNYQFKLPEKFNNRITFVGPENHQPNKQGVDWFLKNSWNKIIQSNPQMHFEVIGNWTSETKVKYETQYPNLSFLGFVSSLQEVLIGSIMIVPIHVGSGIRMKIQEAANIGIPFVTTTIGVEGLPFRNEIDCFIEDDATKFANRIIELQNLHKQKKMASAAYQTVTNFYTFEHLQTNRLSIYKQILKK